MTRVFKNAASAAKVLKAYHDYAGDPTQLFELVEYLSKEGFYVAGQQWKEHQIWEVMSNLY